MGTALFDIRNVFTHQNDKRHENAKQTDISKDFMQDYFSKKTQ